MTLKRKILTLIFLLTFLIIFAMSGIYYYLFIRQVEIHSHEQLTLAFEIIFDDLRAKVSDFTAKIENFTRSSLSRSMYLLELYQTQYNEMEQPWSAREVRKIMTHLSSIANETRKFGELVEAVEILVYDSNRTLLAMYQNQDGSQVTGVYLPQVFESEIIPLTPKDEWFTKLTDLEDVPRQAFPEQVALIYQNDIGQAKTVSLKMLEGMIIMELVAPIIQQGETKGVCVINIRLHQRDVERYSRLSKTKVNVFAGTELSIGTLPEYKQLSADRLNTRHTFNLLNLPENLPLDRFWETTVNGQHYYQGMLVLGDEQNLLGAIMAFYPRSLEEQVKKEFMMLAVVIFASFGLLTAAGASFLSAIIVKPITRLTQIIQQLSLGDFTGLRNLSSKEKAILANKNTKDELEFLLCSFHAMVAYLREMAAVAERISRGEIEQDVTPRSEKDVLGNAFHRMTEYLTTIAAVATAFSEGDLRQNITPRTEQDILGQAFHRLGSLRQAMSDIMDGAEQIRTSSEELNEISTQLSSGAHQSSQTAQEVSASSSHVSENVGEVATATRQMAANIREISKHTEDVADVVNTAVNTAKSAGSTISDLEVRSEEIGKIIKVITTITQQTNLLALNATIEAARAGDSGKGFAVVASEVKDLAREITNSAEDITHKVEAIQSSSQKATTAISEMSKNIQQVQMFTDVIVASVSEQAATTDVITRSLAEAAHGSEAVSHAISDVATVAHESSELAVKVQHSAERQATISEQLRSLIGKFKI